MSGLELAARLAALGMALPFVVITAHGDVASARAAFRLNAVDFLEKPFDDDQLVDAIEAAFAREAGRVAERGGARRRERSLAALSPREREIALLVASGMRNRAHRRAARHQPAHRRGPQGARDGEARRQGPRRADPQGPADPRKGAPLRARANVAAHERARYPRAADCGRRRGTP